MNNAESTRCLPGQIRFPNPNADVNTGSSRKLPSGFRNRSGLKESGSGYISGSRRIALQSVRVKLYEIGRISYHVFPITTEPDNMARSSMKERYVKTTDPWG